PADGGFADGDFSDSDFNDDSSFLGDDDLFT
ncbi:ABC transporter substrate-binding protein, partial [Pseudomonas aeruginosa]